MSDPINPIPVDLKKKRTTKTPKKLSPNKFFVSDVKAEEKVVTIQFPRSILDYLELASPQVYWVAVNGVIQISGVQPTSVIPMIGNNVKQFIPQNS